MATASKRLASLDLLRGTDIFLLTVVSVILDAAHRAFRLPSGLMHQLSHPEWTGFTAYDMIMPLFIFMCGAALPLALPRRLEADGHAGWPYWRHVFGRVAMLWVFGMVTQGELLSFDLHRISFFNNTLQTIACGYAIAATVMLVKSIRTRVATAFALVFAYTAFLHLCGDMTPCGNAAVVCEVKFLSLFYPSATWHPVKQIADWHYTWWPTIPMFGFMSLSGAFATDILRSSLLPQRRAALLACAGLGLLALGGVFAMFDPVVKHIFTASFTFLAMGVACLLYAAYYWLFDIVGVRRGTRLLALFGRHSLFAYMCVETTFRSVFLTAAAAVLCGTSRRYPDGLSRFMGSQVTFNFIMACCSSALLCLALYAWERYARTRTVGKESRE